MDVFQAIIPRQSGRRMAWLRNLVRNGKEVLHGVLALPAVPFWQATTAEPHQDTVNSSHFGSLYIHKWDAGQWLWLDILISPMLLGKNVND